MALATEQGFAFRLAHGQALHDWALAIQGQGKQGIVEIRQGLMAALATGDKAYTPHILGKHSLYPATNRSNLGNSVLPPAWPACGSPRASARRPPTCWNRCTSGLLRALTRRTFRTRKHFWRRQHNEG
jgi:hypothetical protein